MAIDRIIYSRNVFTGENETTAPLALALENDRIAALGSAEDMLAFAAHRNAQGPVAKFLDFEDALVVPGFHDSHVHFFHSSVYSSSLAVNFLGENEADCVRRMQEFAKTRPNGWLLSQGWREYRWNPPLLPSKHSLDKAFPNRPVAMYSGDAHTLWLNTCAMSELGLSAASVPPAGGSYDRDEHGELTGIIRESAAMELMPRIMGAFTDDEIAQAYRGFLARCAQNGITGVCDMSLMAHLGLDFIRDDIHARLLANGELTARISMFPTLLADQSRLAKMQTIYTHPLLQAPGFKQFFDGVSSQHTAWITEPYTNARFDGDCGRATINPKTMRDYVLAAAQEGRAVRIHTIGDAAIHEALNIYEEALRKFGPLHAHQRNCLEHLENFLPEDIGRLAKLNVVAAMQPGHITLDPGGPERDLGEERVAFMWPFKALLDAGVTLAFGTDSPVVDVNSVDLLYTAVTRQDASTHLPEGGWLPQERISMAQAIRAYTAGSAAAASRAHELGTLAPGMLADITVLDRNLLSCKAQDIQKTQVLATFTGGRPVFKR